MEPLLCNPLEMHIIGPFNAILMNAVHVAVGAQISYHAMTSYYAYETRECEYKTTRTKTITTTFDALKAKLLL